jgi:hypothetical protein
MGIGHSHPLYAYTFDQLARIYAPAASELALQWQIEPRHIDGQVVNPHGLFPAIRQTSCCAAQDRHLLFQGFAG